MFCMLSFVMFLLPVCHRVWVELICYQNKLFCVKSWNDLLVHCVERILQHQTCRRITFFMWLSFSQLYRPNIYPMDPGGTGIHLGVYMAPFFFYLHKHIIFTPCAELLQIFKRTHHCSQASVCVVMDTTFYQVPLLWGQNDMNCYCFAKWARVWQEHLATPKQYKCTPINRSIKHVCDFSAICCISSEKLICITECKFGVGTVLGIQLIFGPRSSNTNIKPVAWHTKSYTYR